ncbi:transposase [Myxococcus sp. MISCRS1]|nr:transposase [Myxococcus sp. AS-1-15]MBZ4394231.1 transposase [Myxococcus sp. AS-1-15]MCY1001199.1 transposase [Myxococcus sp. MISCRS1]
MERAAPSEEVWLLVEWPRGEAGPTKYYLSSLPEDTLLKELVRMARLRWRVERDYQEMKGEVGLDHFEGRSWRGFHHHATLCMVAHGFLALRRALSPRRKLRWTLPQVRRQLQLLLLRRIGHCPLCLRPLRARAAPRGPSRM